VETALLDDVWRLVGGQRNGSQKYTHDPLNIRCQYVQIVQKDLVQGFFLLLSVSLTDLEER
jgi:hypothetical protein